MRMLVVVLAVAVMAGIVFTLSRWNISPNVEKPPQLNPRVPVQLWPGGKAWSWSVQFPPTGADGDWIALLVREKVMPRAASTSHPGHPAMRGMRPEEADREFGTGYSGRFAGDPPLPEKGEVAVQLMDLSEIGAASSKPGQSLRVLATLEMGGVQMRLSGDDIYLPAGRFGGHSVQFGRQEWVHGEMYLMTFFVQGEEHWYQYDVLLRHRADE